MQIVYIHIYSQFKKGCLHKIMNIERARDDGCSLVYCCKQVIYFQNQISKCLMTNTQSKMYKL